MPKFDGIAATRELTLSQACARVIVLTTYGLDDNVDAALRAGAAGFVTKSTAPDQLITAVRQVAVGESVLGATSLDSSSTASSANPHAPNDRLRSTPSPRGRSRC